MHAFTTLVLVLFVAAGGYYLYQHGSALKTYIGDQMDSGQFLTIEPHYTATQIMSAHQRALITSDKQSFQEPTLKFYPYLLLQVSYSNIGHKPVEGILLWSQSDGELVSDTKIWSTTKGFADLIANKAKASDYKIVKALAANQGTMSREQLRTYLSVSSQTADAWIQQAYQKHLIGQQGDRYVLTQKSIEIEVQPQTKISQRLGIKPYSHTHRKAKRFSANDIEKAIRHAFGSDLNVRSAREVYLPVYNISVVNRNGTVRSTTWNALSGQPLKRG